MATPWLGRRHRCESSARVSHSSRGWGARHAAGIIAGTAICVTTVTAAGAEDATAPDAITLASWNVEWLADAAVLERADYWRRCEAAGWSNEKPSPSLPFCDVYRRHGIANGTTYRDVKLGAVRGVLDLLADRRTDVVLVQEVGSAEALRAVLPPGYRVLCATTRDDAQNLGIAVRESFAPEAMRCEEVRSLSLEDVPDIARPLRRGLALSFVRAGQRFVVLTVHLKAGCPVGPLDRSADGHCRLLVRQVPRLEAWLEARAAAGESFAVVGDWNRDLEAEVRGGYRARNDGSDRADPARPEQIRNVFPELDDGEPEASALRLAATDRGAAVHGACHPHLDQAVVSRTLLAQLEPASLVAGLAPARLIPVPASASDHCVLEMRWVFR